MAPVALTTDAQVQQDVLRELKWDTRVDETDVGVEVDDGVVTLTGTVANWGIRLAAEEAAHRVKGVLDVANDIVVKVAGAGPPNDTDIALAARRTLEWDVFVPESRIRTTVSAGVVTLEGEVDYWSQRDSAERAVRNLNGVRSVVNRIDIKARAVDPAVVRRSIEEALERQAQREARRLTLDVHDGEVTLTGTVHSWAERETALGAAKGAPGVRTVKDELRIVSY
jgi:osmotically-inducible protein OsmY